MQPCTDATSQSIHRMQKERAHLVRQPCVGINLKEVTLVVYDCGALGGIPIVVHLQ